MGIVSGVFFIVFLFIIFFDLHPGLGDDSCFERFWRVFLVFSLYGAVTFLFFYAFGPVPPLSAGVLSCRYSSHLLR